MFNKISKNLENIPKEVNDKKEKTLISKPLEELKLGETFILDGRKGRVVVPITKGENSRIEIVWLDDNQSSGRQRLSGHTLVETSKKEVEQVEWQNIKLGDIKPHQIFRYEGKEGVLLTKPFEGSNIKVRFKGEDGSQELPWETRVEIKTRAQEK